MAFADDSFLPGDDGDGYPKRPKQPFSLEDQLYDMGGVGGGESPYGSGGDSPWPELPSDGTGPYQPLPGSAGPWGTGGGFPETTPTGPIDDPWADQNNQADGGYGDWIDHEKNLGKSSGWDGQEMHYGQAGPNDTVVDSGFGEGAGTVNPKGPFDPFKHWGTSDRPINADEATANAGSGFTKPTAPGTGTPDTTGGSTKKGKDWFLEWTNGKAPNKETLLANEKELNAHGYTLVPNKTLGPDGKPTNYDLMYNGQIIDVVVGGSRGGEAWQYDDSGGSGGAAGGGGGAAGGGSYPGANGAVGEAIARLLARGEAPVSLKDPSLAGASAAHRAAMTRGVRNSRTALAERAAANGLNSGGAGSGAFDTGIQSQEEGAALNNANFDSGLVIDEVKQRRSDVINALQFAQGEERMALQHALAMLNDQLARAQMGQQNKQWYDAFTYGMSRDSKNADDHAAGGLY